MDGLARADPVVVRVPRECQHDVWRGVEQFLDGASPDRLAQRLVAHKHHESVAGPIQGGLQELGLAVDHPTARATDPTREVENHKA